MWAIARFILSFLSLVAISNALDSCTISGLTETHVVDGIRIARGSIGLGSMASNALFFFATSRSAVQVAFETYRGHFQAQGTF